MEKEKEKYLNSLFDSIDKNYEEIKSVLDIIGRDNGDVVAFIDKEGKTAHEKAEKENSGYFIYITKVEKGKWDKNKRAVKCDMKSQLACVNVQGQLAQSIVMNLIQRLQ